MPRLPRPAGRHRDDPAKAVTPTTTAAYLACFFAIAMVVLLALQLANIERQRRVAARQEGRVKALIEAVAPTVKEAKGAQPRLVAGLERADELIRELQLAGTPEAIAKAGELARALQGADAADAIRSTGNLARALSSGDRTADLIDRASGLVAEAARQDTPGDVDATRRITADLLLIARELDGTQEEALAINREVRDLFRESIQIQRELLVHTRSIDQKFGGTAPGAQTRSATPPAEVP